MNAANKVLIGYTSSAIFKGEKIHNFIPEHETKMIEFKMMHNVKLFPVFFDCRTGEFVVDDSK